MWNAYGIKSEEMGQMNLGLGNDHVAKSEEMECLYGGIRSASKVQRHRNHLSHTLMLICQRKG